MSGRGYYTYLKTTSHQQEAIREDLSQLEISFNSLQNRSSRELMRLTNSLILPNSFNLKNEEKLNEPPTSSEKLPKPRQGVESIYYLDYEGRVLFNSHKNKLPLLLKPKHIQQAIHTLSESQNSTTILDCYAQCYQHIFIPAKNDSNNRFIINVNRSANLLFNDFTEVSGAEIAIIAISKNESDSNNHRTIYTSDPKLSKRLIDNFDLATFINDSIIDSGHFFSARLFPLNQSINNQYYVAVIKDNSKLQQQIAQVIKEIFISSLITLTIILLLIAIILRPSLYRLSELTKILPLLPHGRYDEVKSSLYKLQSQSRWIDEIDTLAATIAKVIDSLDSMDQIVNSHKEELAVQIRALTEAKVFNETLLDNSPLAIIIHDGDGKIRNINRLGRELTGLLEQTPADANINNWVKNDGQYINLSASLYPLLKNEDKKVQGETSFFTADNRQLDFLWTHSSLNIDGDRKILSLGIDITERHEAAESLRWLGQHDRVTGLLNRSSFTEDANNFIKNHSKKMHIELLMLDIDDFAMFNDRRGFDAGDKLLNDFAAHLCRSLPPNTLLSRTGSGEFCALIAHRVNVDTTAKDLSLEHLTRYTFRNESSSEEICLSGVVDAFNNSLSGIDELISNTTSTMFRVKSKLRGQLYYAANDDSPDDSSRSSRHQKYRMKEQLLSALNDNRLVLFYQPIVNLKTNNISHCECLVRLLDSESQFIDPAQFLGIASESGLLPKLDYSVLEKAMRQQSLWEESGITTGLSINVTAPTLEQADFQQKFDELLQLTGANPHRLILEIVETDAISNLNITRNLLNHFKTVGTQIAFDDFGIGFTSFEYVRDLPVDFIKIDQSFIRFIHEREQDRVLVKSMVEMSHSLGKKVIVEGIENRAALAVVKEIGVEYVQGYHICRPMPISALDLSLHLRY